MFQLILTACLAASSGVCVPIVLPASETAVLADCQSNAARISQAWLADHPTLTGDATECLPAESLPALDLQEVAPGIHVHLGRPVQLEEAPDGRIANLSVVIGERSVAVVDSGVSRAQGQALYVAIRRLTDLPISHMILTHMHPDHALGASVFKEAGASIVGHAAMPVALELRAGTYLDNIERLLPPTEVLGTSVVLPDSTVADSADIDLGGRNLTLHAAQTAHTDNDLWVRDDMTNTVFSGDLVFRELTPILDGSLTGWLHWLDMPLEPMPRLIVPGHGNIAHNWEEATQPQKQFLKALADATRRQINEGVSMSEAVPSIVNSLQIMQKQWNSFEASAARDATAAYKELEWE